MFSRLSSRLTAVIVGVAILPLVLVVGVLLWNARTNQRDAAQVLQDETSKRLAQEIETFITSRPRDLRLITEVHGWVDLSPDEQRVVLSELLAFDEFFEELVLLDARGHELIRESKRDVVTTTLGNRADQDAFRIPFEQQIDYYSPVQVNEETGELLMTIGIPLVDLRTGDVANVLVGDFRFKAVTELLQAEEFQPGEDVYVVLVEDDAPTGEALVDNPELVIAHKNPSVVLGKATVEIDDIDGTTTGLHGDEVIVGLSSFTVGDQAFAVVAELTTDEAYRKSNEALQTTSIMAFVVLVLVAAGGYYFSQWIARPIGELATVARQIGGGDLNVKAKSGGSYEIATLSDTFNSMTAQLASVIGSLEDRVAARTQDLFLTLEVGQLAARIYQQAELLPRVADFIRERFDLYYTQIYLVDEAGRYAYLEAGTGEVGRQLLERGHRLDLSETSIVARTYQSQRPVLVMDTDASDIHRPNPLLPETRSEVAIPLIVGDQTLGVLDMQAREAEIFHEDNLPVFEAMANQLAAALRSAQAYEETQIAIKRADEINRRLTGEAWTGYLARLTRDKAVGYRYDLQEVESIDASLLMQDTSNGGKLVRQPVLLRDEPIGTIQIVEDAARDWSADDLALVEAVADRVALALEQFRAFDETQQALNETAVQAQRLSLLNDLAAEISAAETLADVYRIVAVRTDEVLTSDRASIAMLTPDETRFEIYGLDGERGAIPLGAQLPRAGTWVGEVIDGNRARVLPDMAVVPYLEAQQLVKQGLHSSLNAPLVVHGRPIGTLNVARAEINAYSQRDTDLLTQIASLLSAQIENRGLLEQAQKRAAEMQTVAEVGTEASSALDPDELLWKVVNLVKERFDLYHAHIYLVDDTGERLILTAGAGDVGQKMVERRRGIALTHEHSLVARAARDRQGVIVNDVTLAPDFLPNPMLPNTRAEMAIPMVVGTQLLGVLDVQSTEVGRFTDEDLRVKGTLAAQIATAVQNARLFTEAQSRLAIIESSDNFIAMADMEANLLYINPAGARLVGYDSVDEFMAKVTQNSAIHPPEGLERIEREAMPEVFGDSGFWRGENTILHRDGTIIEVEQAIFFLYEVDGTPRNIVSIMTDIRQRKAAQEELDRERRTLQTVLTNLPVGVFMADAATGGSLLANDAALDMLGRGLDPASSTNQLAEVYDAYKFGTDELYPVDQMPLVRGMSGESVQIDDMEIRRPDGKRILLEVTGAPITDAQGNVTASLAVFNDITERRRAEEERQQFLIETQARYEAGRQLVAATNYEETLRAITRYSFRDGAVVGSLYAVELDEAGEPEWIEAIANVKAHDDVFINSPVGSRYYVPELLFTQLWIVDAERPQLINDITSDERVTAEMREVLRQSGHRAMLTLPLTLGGQWIGVANFFWEQPHMFTDSEERFYAAMSGQMASVLQSMRLLQVTEKRAGEMATVAEVGAEAAASLDANRLLSDVVNLTKERFNLYHAHVYLVNETGRYLQLAAGAGQIGQMMVGTSYRIALDHERSLVARAARSREGVIVDDVTQVDDFLPNPMLPETRSEMAIPMIVGDRVLGVLDVQSNKAAYFDRDDLQVLSTLASQIAVSVNNARLFEDQVAAAHQREALNELSQAMLAAETLDEIYATVTEVLVKQFDMAFVRVWTLDKTNQEMVLQASAGLYTHLGGPHSRVPLDSDLKLARIAHQRAPHITNDLLGDPWIDNNEWVAETGMGAFAGYPLFAGDELVGVIGMFSYRSIEDEALPVLQSLALQVGTLVQNQQLFEQAARRAAEMQAVAEVGAEASASLDPEELLWTIAALTKDRFDLYHAHIYLFDEAAESLRLAAGAGNVGRAMVAAGHRISLGHERSLVARAARSREGVIVNNVTQAPDFLPNPMLPDTRSEMAIPMIVGDQMLGVLDVQSSQLDRFSDEDIQVMSVLAGQVAVAEQNAHLFSEAQQRLAIIESASNAIFLSNTGGELVYLNPYGLQWLGYDSLDEVLGKIMVELQAPDAERLQTEVASALRETGQWSGESVVVHKGGYVFPVEMTAFIIYDEDGNPEFYGSIMTDITERKAAEAELDSQRRTLEALLDNLPVGVFMAEVGTGLPLQVNNRALEMLGRGLAPDASADELAEVYAAFKYGTDEPYPSEQMPLVRGMQGEAAFVDDMEIHRPDDTNILLEVRGAPIFDASGEVTASVAVFTDITARYQAEQERIRLLTDLQQTGDALAERIKELAALQDVGAYGEENLALEEYLTRVANRIPDSMQFPDNCVSVIEYGGEVYGDARALNAPVSLVHDLEVGDEVYGRLVVGYTEEREFQTEEVPHLRDIAGRVSSYLENRQLFEQTQQALSETALLYNAGRRIVDASNIQSLVEVVATAVPIRAINRAVLFTLELDENGQLSTARSIGNWHSGVGEEPSEIGRMYEVGQVPTIALMATENAVFVNDVMHDERVEAGARAVFEMQQIASVAILPLWVGRRQVGTMLLETQEQHTFTPEEMRPFAALSGQMASALDSLLLLEQTQKRAAEMQAVSEVGAEAASSLNTDRLLKTVSELTKERFGLYHAHVYLLDDEERNLILRAGAGVAGDMMAQGGHHIPLSHQQSLVVQAALRRQPIIANNVTQASDFLPNPMLPQTKAELATPMIAGGEVIGVLDVQADQIDFFSQEDMQVQMTLASQVAVAVQNARLFSEQVAVAEQLREVDRLKSEFLASMSHELRTPLNSIIGYAEVLLDGIDGELTDDMEEDVGAIHGSGKHLLNLINDILDLAKIEAGQMDLVVEDFDLRPVAEDMANTNRILLKDKPVDIVLDIPDDLPQIHADSLRIRQVVSNLLTNAIKFTEEGSITLRARPFPADPKMVEIAIVDTGMGMNEKQLQVIFDRFRQVDQSHTRRAGGTGLGLSITRQLIEMHGGEIWVESEPDVGSTFAFTLPLATEGID